MFGFFPFQMILEAAMTSLHHTSLRDLDFTRIHTAVAEQKISLVIYKTKPQPPPHIRTIAHWRPVAWVVGVPCFLIT